MTQQTPNGLTYPEAGDHTRLWEHIQQLAEDVDPQLSPSQVQTFETSGTWTRPDCKWVRVRVMGGGGAGGGVGATGSGEAAEAGGGGGGGYAEKVIPRAELGSTEAVTVGAGGSAASAGNNPGGPGGSSSFGSHCSATGGGGGGGMSSTSGSAVASRGAGGLGSGGDLDIQGTPGRIGRVLSSNYVGLGDGGGGPLGGDAPNAAASGAGLSGRAYGGGSSGARNGGGQVARPSTAGAAGIVIVEAFF